MTLYTGLLSTPTVPTLQISESCEDTFFVQLLESPIKSRGWLLSTLQPRANATTLSKKLVLWSLSMEE